MPLRVHCPNGCLIRLPNSRSGKVVRCSECKATLRLPQISESEAQSGKPIPIEATLIAQVQPVQDAEETAAPESHPHSESSEALPTTSLAAELQHMKPEHVNSLEHEDAAASEEQSTTTVGSEQESVPAEINIATEPSERMETFLQPKVVEIQLESNSTDQKPPPAKTQSKTNTDSLEEIASQISTAAPTELRSKTHSATTTIKPVNREKKVDIQLKSANSHHQRKKDFKTIARFYGVCVGLLGLLGIIPAIVILIRLQQQDFSPITPRWIYMMMFVGALHLIYAVYLIQIADWSALWAVSILMLLASCVYGLFGAAIMLDAGQGAIPQFLQLAGSELRTAGTGCMVGLLFSVLTSYLCGREALNWQKTEKKLLQIAILRQQQSAPTA